MIAVLTTGARLQNFRIPHHPICQRSIDKIRFVRDYFCIKVSPPPPYHNHRSRQTCSKFRFSFFSPDFILFSSSTSSSAHPWPSKSIAVARNLLAVLHGCPSSETIRDHGLRRRSECGALLEVPGPNFHQSTSNATCVYYNTSQTALPTARLAVFCWRSVFLFSCVPRSGSRTRRSRRFYESVTVSIASAQYRGTAATAVWCSPVTVAPNTREKLSS